MARPQTKKDLLEAATSNYDKLPKLIASMTEMELSIEFDFSADAKKKEAQKRSITTAVGAGVGAIAGGVLAYEATKSIQNSKLDSVEKAAYDEWMNEVGNHIRCFVGGDEVGMYGDIISTSME